MLKNSKIFFKLLGSFMIIILMACMFGIVAIKTIASMSGITSQLYRHPFTVATEVLKANADIMAIDRSMKDVVLAEDEDSLQQAIDLVNSYENSVYQSFDLVKERFLGDSAQLERVLETIRSWRPIRQEVINLVGTDRRQEALAITHGKGLLHLQKIIEEMNDLVQFAEGKALNFMQKGLNKGRSATQLMSVFLLIVFAAAALIAFLATFGITSPLGRIIHQMRLIARGESGNQLVETDRKDELGELALAAQSFDRAVQDIQQLNSDLQQQHWVRSSIAELVKKVQLARTSEELFDAVISFIVRTLNGGYGVFYYYDADNDHLRLLGTFAVEDRCHVRQILSLGEGLIGQSALERNAISLTEVPADYMQINSGLGSAQPTQLNILPVVFKEQLLGVIEVGLFEDLNAQQRKFLEQLMPVLALNLANFMGNQKTIELLNKTMLQAEELQVSEEELRKAAEELKSTNKELRQNSELLNAQSQELQASEEELRVINEELSIKNQLLDHQKQELELASAEAEKKAEELSRTNQYKTEFLANMSHELRTPLNSLLILSRSMANNENGDLSTEYVESAQIIYESASELLRLINDILDLSKVEAGKIEVIPEPCSTSDLADSLYRQFAHMAARKEVGFEIVVDKRVPVEFLTDQNKLRQILVNLLSNAIKFTGKGMVTLTILAFNGNESEQAGEDQAISDLVFKVKDTGLGIPPAQIQIIFEEFKQVNGSASQAYGGTGLGLAIASGMARLLGGKISVSSKEGQGSEFTLMLPLRAVEDHISRKSVPLLNKSAIANAGYEGNDDNEGGEPRDAQKSSVPDTTEAANFRDKTVLVVDDDMRHIFALSKTLRTRGLSILMAKDGEHALKQIAHNSQVDLIIMDIMMPGLDGYDTMRLIREKAQYANTPIIAVTARAMPGDREKSLAAGANDYLAKPVIIEDLIKKIRYWLGDEK